MEQSPTAVQRREHPRIIPQSAWCLPGQAARMVAVPFDRKDPYRFDASATK